MKLSIGMIVKNEEKWLDQCLNAIKPILNNVDSELIITDTGSTDKTVEIAKKYTDKILYHKWTKDFAAARNTCLLNANGEWFMSLDADEIFNSCDNIIHFFNSGEYKKYNAASYIVRNLFNYENNTSYSDILSPRMVRIYPETRYEGVVHEYLTTFKPPFKNLRDIAVHYGYLYETQQDNYNKMMRNRELLLKKLEIDGDSDPMVYVQLYENQVSIKEYVKQALDYLEKGINVSRKQGSIVLIALYFHKASYYYTENDYKTTIDVCDDYFRIDKRIRPYELNTDAEIYALKAKALYALERYEEAEVAYKQFFDTFRKIESGKIATYDAYLYANYSCTDINILPNFNCFMECCIKTDKFYTADMYLCTFPFRKYLMEQSHINKLVYHMIKIAETNYFCNIKKYYNGLDEYGRNVLIDEIFRETENDKYRHSIFNILSEIAKKNCKLDSKLEIYRLYYDNQNVSERIDTFSISYGVNDDVDLIYISLKCQYDISMFFNLPKFDMKRSVFIACRNIDGFFEAAENYSADSIKNNNKIDEAVRFYDYCISMKLMDNESKTTEEKEQLISKLFKVKQKLINRQRNIGNNTFDELEKLAAIIKKNIRGHIASGDIVLARKTLDEYKQINPGDSELSELDLLVNQN